MNPKQERRADKDLMKNAAPVTICLIIVVGYFLALGSLLYNPYPAESKDLITSLIETLKNILIMAVSYFVGSNSSSKAKDDVIGDIAKMPVAPIAPIAPVAPVAAVAPVLPIAPLGREGENV